MERFIESESDTEGVPMDGLAKRKSPSVDGKAPVAPNSPMDTGFKHPRKYSFEPELPPLRDNEAELILNIADFIGSVEGGDLDSSGFGRSEVESDHVVLQGLTFTLVSYLTRRLDHNGSPSYDLGLYTKVLSPKSDEESWSYRSVSMMVMLINASNPYSDDSKVSRDTCQFNSHDPCRGWSAMISFRSLDDLQQRGFTYNTGLIKCRGQVSFEGSAIVIPSNYVVPYRGLENMGATCYLAALLQSLFHIGTFRQLVYSSPAADDSDILSALQCVFSDLEESDTVSGVSAEPLTHAFGWDLADVGIQHDAQELNRILIDRIESLHKDEVARLFSGELENYIECLDVEYTSRRVEKFYDLQMNLIYHDPQTGDPQPITSLAEAIEKYLQPEILDGQNLYDAESFGKQRARKGVRFVSVPPVLSFQLMRFQFDYESCEMKKLNARFSFPERLVMSDHEYVLHSVLVHSGNVNAGHYYAYVRPDGRTDWYKFDDTEVRKVDSFTAIDNNFGGPPQVRGEKLVDYLHETSDDSNISSTQRDKVFSAYMLTYVQVDKLDEVLRSARFFDLPESVRENINERKRVLKEKLAQTAKRCSRRTRRRASSSAESSTAGADDELVPLRIIQLDGEEKIFDSLVTSPEAIKSSWLTDFEGIPYAINDSVIDVPGSELIGNALKHLFGQERSEGEIFFMVSDPENRVRFLELSENEAKSATLKDLSRHVAPAPVVLVVSFSQEEVSGEKFFVVEYDVEKREFEFRGIVAVTQGDDTADRIKRAINNQVWGENACEFFAHTRYFNLEKLESFKNLEAGMFIVFQNTSADPHNANADQYMQTLSNTFEIDLYVHDALRDKWLLGEVPAIEHALLPNNKGEWKRPIDHMRVSIDVRNEVNSLGAFIPGFSTEIAELLVFCDDPLLDEVKAGEDVNQEGWKMVDVIGRRGLQFHCAPIPRAVSTDIPERWLETKPICVRYFSPKVIEERCVILHVSANTTVGEILRKAKESIGIEGRLRLLEIEPHDCEIIAVHGEQDTIPASTLMCWGARNILASSLRMELDDGDEGSTRIWCHHFERTTRRRFGHPFILNVSSNLEEARRESVVREMIAQKLDVPLQTVRGWRIAEATASDHLVLEMAHASNPWTSKGTPRERGLVIKG